jgi:hypothetical protein
MKLTLLKKCQKYQNYVKSQTCAFVWIRISGVIEQPKSVTIEMQFLRAAAGHTVTGYKTDEDITEQVEMADMNSVLKEYG